MVNITESTTASIMVTMEKNNQKKKINKVALVGVVIFLLIAIVSGGVFIVQAVNRKQAEDLMEELAENTFVPKATEETVEASVEKADTTDTVEAIESEAVDPIDALREKGIPIPEKEIDFAELQANTNADIYAWIYLPDSKIDYPIVQHPTDNYYYLNHNLNGSKGYPGCIYTEDYNTKDFTDPNTVIYGHNMKNETMFAGLHNFEDIQYFDENRYVYIYTPDELLVYEIFAAYEYDDKHLLYNYDYTNETIYQNYLNEIGELRSTGGIIKEDIEVTTEDKIITLSTCIANKPNNRYLVQGVLLNEEK